MGGEGEADKNNRLPQLWGAYQLALLQERENSDSKMGEKKPKQSIQRCLLQDSPEGRQIGKTNADENSQKDLLKVS